MLTTKYGVDAEGKLNGVKLEDLVIVGGMLKNADPSTNTEKKKKKASYDVDEIPEPPEGFTLVEMSYLHHDKVKGVKQAIKRFSKFADAVAELNEGEYRGITKTSRGYECRVGLLRQTLEKDRRGGIASYVKTVEFNRGGEEREIENRISKHIHTGGEGVVISESEGSSEGSSGEEPPEYTEEPVVKPERKKKKKKGIIFNNKSKKEPEPEPVVEEEEEVEEEDLDVEQIQINGKEYYYEEVRNKIYDPETQAEVGFMNDEGEYELN